MISKIQLQRLPSMAAFFASSFWLTQCNDEIASASHSVEVTLKTEEVTEVKVLPLVRVEKSYPMMGTKFSVIVYAEDEAKALSDIEKAYQLAANVNATCSDYRATSELVKFNNAPTNQAVVVSDILWNVLDQSAKMVELSNGSFDPTMGAHTYQWRLSRLDKKLPSAEELEANKTKVGWDGLSFDAESKSITKLREGIRLDLGGIAKGYAADMMFDFLNKAGYKSCSVSAGGDLRMGESPPDQLGWKVGIKNLDDNGEVSPKKILLKNCAVSTSGDIHQFIELGGKRYSHIIDPTTGLGMTDRVSATVVAPNATLSDVYATTACISENFTNQLIKMNDVSLLKITLKNEKLESLKSGLFKK